MFPCLLACCFAAAVAAEPAWAPLPDPYGLGPRLVTIEHLRNLKVAVPAGASDAEIRDLYHAVTARQKTPALIDGEVDEAARRRDLIARQRRVLKERYGVEAPTDADEAELNALLADLAQRQDQRTQEDIARLVESDRQRAAAEEAAATLVKRTDGPSGITWMVPRLVEDYEAQRSPYVVGVFGLTREGGVTPLQLRLVVFLPTPPSGEPTITLLAGELTMPLQGFALKAVATDQGTLRAEAEVELTFEGTRDALRRVIDQSDPRVEFRFGTQQFVVPIDDQQRRALRQVLNAHAAAERSTAR